MERRSLGAAIRAIKVQALYRNANARQQLLGPAITYGDPSVDNRLGILALTSQLIRAATVAFRLEYLQWTMKRLWPERLSARDRPNQHVLLVRTLHCVNDQWMLLLGLIVGAAHAAGVTHIRLIRGALRFALHAVRRRAVRVGDSFSIGNVQKYESRLGIPGATEEAARTHGLLRDPLSAALVYRDLGNLHMREAAHSQLPGRFDLARHSFRRAFRLAVVCGSDATALKALAGLHACGGTQAVHARCFARISQRIEGYGFKRYCARVQSRNGFRL